MTVVFIVTVCCLVLLGYSIITQVYPKFKEDFNNVRANGFRKNMTIGTIITYIALIILVCIFVYAVYLTGTQAFCK